MSFPLCPCSLCPSVSGYLLWPPVSPVKSLLVFLCSAVHGFCIVVVCVLFLAVSSSCPVALFSLFLVLTFFSSPTPTTPTHSVLVSLLSPVCLLSVCCSLFSALLPAPSFVTQLLQVLFLSTSALLFNSTVIFVLAFWLLLFGQCPFYHFSFFYSRPVLSVVLALLLNLLSPMFSMFCLLFGSILDHNCHNTSIKVICIISTLMVMIYTPAVFTKVRGKTWSVSVIAYGLRLPS